MPLIATAIVALALKGPKLFEFSGGSAQQLAASLVREQGASVVIMLAPKMNIPKFEVRYSDFETLHRILQARGGLQSETKLTMGYGPKAWPAGIWKKSLAESDYLQKIPVDPKPFLAWSNGRVSLKTSDGKGIRLSQLGSLLKKNLRWHPFYQDVMLCIDAKDETPAKLLELVSSAIGSHLNPGDESAFFDLNPSAIRSRGIGYCRLPVQSDIPQLAAMVKADNKYVEEVLKAYSDRRIRFFFSGQDGVVPYGQGHPVFVAAHQRAAAYRYGHSSSGNHRVIGGLASIIDKIVVDEPVKSMLRPDGFICCRYAMNDGTWLDF